MKSNYVRHKLAAGESSVGTWLALPDVVAARLMTSSGFDWLTVELEHSPSSFETAAACFAVIAESGTVPLVRVPWNTIENIKRVLDIGAWGVVVPMVNSRAEAEAAIPAIRYQPLGQRSVGGNMHAANFGTDTATYYARANDEILAVVMIETVKAVAAADEILAVPGVDVVFIGPNDLTNSMGKAPSFESDDQDFVDALDHVLAMAKKHGVTPGIHVPSAEAAKRRLDQGFRFIAIASEAGFMLSKAQEVTQFLGLAKDAATATY